MHHISDIFRWNGLQIRDLTSLISMGCLVYIARSIRRRRDRGDK